MLMDISLGVAIALPREMPEEDRRKLNSAINEIADVPEDGHLGSGLGFDFKRFPQIGQWRLEQQGIFDSIAVNLRGETWTASPGGCAHWASVTPVVFDQHGKSRAKAAYLDECAQSVLESTNRLINGASVVDVRVSAISFVKGSPSASSFPRLQRKDGSERRQMHVEILFDSPVTGPLLVGAGRYRGYGPFEACVKGETMNKLTLQDFRPFFNALYKYDPFPWQTMLLERVADPNRGWPDLIDLPTASGKTACIDVAIFALAMGVKSAPRRIWFVVDRRIVVDEAFRRAEALAVAMNYSLATESKRVELDKNSYTEPILAHIHDRRDDVVKRVAENLRDLSGCKPLEVGRLRGGIPRLIGWAGNPAQPAVITSTVDQIGSRLLFRGYGLGQFSWPIHAALASNDSLIVLDEAHLAKPFYQTVQAIEKYRKVPWAVEPLPTPFKLVVMSATPPDEDHNSVTRFPEPQDRTTALNHPTLDERRSVRKPTELAIAKKPKIPKDAEETQEDELVLDAAARALGFIAKAASESQLWSTG